MTALSILEPGTDGIFVGQALPPVNQDLPPRGIRHWWRHTGDAMAVSREIFGIANAWAGFPVKSERW